MEMQTEIYILYLSISEAAQYHYDIIRFKKLIHILGKPYNHIYVYIKQDQIDQ